MSWRTVVISSRSKLDYKMDHLVVRSDEGEKRIHLGDISVLVCESTAISITAYLLAELTAHKIKVIFCDNRHNPLSELVPCRGSYDTSGKIREQIKWPAQIKAKIWQEIVKAKILNQSRALIKLGKAEPAMTVGAYASEVRPNDSTNREGHAAKVYFNSLFDDDFFRNADDIRNKMLDYGYSVLLACFNREIATQGYLTQIGIWHDNSANPFNLGSDLMESFRPIIDYHVAVSDAKTFSSEEKHSLVNLLNQKIKIAGSSQYLSNAIGIYARSIFTAISENNVKEIHNWYEL